MKTWESLAYRAETSLQTRWPLLLQEPWDRAVPHQAAPQKPPCAGCSGATYIRAQTQRPLPIRDARATLTSTGYIRARLRSVYTATHGHCPHTCAGKGALHLTILLCPRLHACIWQMGLDYLATLSRGPTQVQNQSEEPYKVESLGLGQR